MCLGGVLFGRFAWQIRFHINPYDVMTTTARLNWVDPFSSRTAWGGGTKVILKIKVNIDS
jgi:hypothetical protein